MNIQELTNQESERQKNTLNLIASENYPSKKTLGLLGSVWSNKYGEGYPGRRYYAGNEFTDTLELATQKKALEVFDKTGEYGVNLQVLSGSPANSVVYLSVLELGDTILSLSLPDGGHLSHLHSTSSFNKFFKHENYSVKQTSDNTWEIDMEDLEKKLQTVKTQLTIIGFSAFPRAFDFEPLIELCRKYDSMVLADISHISGLVATGKHSSPFQSGDKGADFVTTTTHKTLRGPRSAMVFAKKDYMDKINRTVFPGTQGGPHFNKIAALYQCLSEITGEDYGDGISFDQYISNVIENTKSMQQALADNGIEIVSPTQTHLMLAKLPDDVDSLEIQKKLENLGIITNRNSIPKDVKSPWRPGGLRLGGAALTSRGLDSQGFYILGEIISQVIKNEYSIEQLKTQINQIIDSLNWMY